MAKSVFNKETLLDLSVNAIPLFIILFFIVVFAVMNPFGPGTVVQAVQFSILVVMFLALGLLTYYSGLAVAGAEAEEAEEAEGDVAEELTAVVEPEGELEAVESEAPEEYEEAAGDAKRDPNVVDVQDAEERVVSEDDGEGAGAEASEGEGEPTDVIEEAERDDS